MSDFSEAPSLPDRENTKRIFQNAIQLLKGGMFVGNAAPAVIECVDLLTVMVNSYPEVEETVEANG